MVSARDAALLALGLLLTPAFAFSDASTGARSATSAVVAHTASYLHTETFTAILVPANTFVADAILARHDYDDDTTLDLVVTKTAGDARFVLVAPTTLAGATAGQALTVRVEDTDAGSSPDPGAVLTLRVDATVRDTGADVGRFSVERDVTVVVPV